MIRVVNKSKHSPTNTDDVYIGRGSVLGNPYTGSKELSQTKALYQCESREQAIEEYRHYLDKKIEEKDVEICNLLNKLYLKALKGDLNLVCYCKPKDCHGDYIKQVIEKKIIKNKLK